MLSLYNQAAAEGRARFSVELLPPLKGDGPGRVFEALDPLREFAPVSVNVTSHREDVKYVERENGLLERHTVRRRPGTVGISAAIMRRYGVEAIPHLICGGQSRYDLEDALIDLDFLGIDNVLALRGDNLRGEHSFRVHPDGHGHACELVRQIARMNEGVFIDGEVEDCHRTNFCIGVAGYPEKHCDKPLIERVVTVTGRAMSHTANLKVRIGTPISSLIEYGGGMPEDTGKIVNGGPMMGRAVANPEAPVTKGTSGILLIRRKGSVRKTPQSCIKCAKCVGVCPMGLEPYLMYGFARRLRYEELEAAHVTDCIECGCCSYTCPADRKSVV